MIAPGCTIGVLGGGQLGRMLILAGREMGYRFHVFEPKGPCAAGMVADLEVNASYENQAALDAFAAEVDVITLEFENIPAEVVDRLSRIKPVFPGSQALHICQHRQREKDFLKANDLPCAPFEYADSAEGLQGAVQAIGFPCVIKTAAFGYDGKGQIKLSGGGTLDYYGLWEQLGQPPRVVVEKWIEHHGEFSVICARNADGTTTTLPLTENIHINHILHASIVPARTSIEVSAKAKSLACDIAKRLNVVGLVAVEFFLDASGSLIINEMAPRPHNSGHYSMNGCATSQFEQHMRAICGLPFGSTELLRPTVMINLLGDLWQQGEPNWTHLLADPNVSLHLYDKGEPRPGRKMGHFNLIGDEINRTLETAEKHFTSLAEA
ncbi:MAG: 5-(carboxyamino)imidazole ribonucleotide synthase [Verrucomicrobiota bacterium]